MPSLDFPLSIHKSCNDKFPLINHKLFELSVKSVKKVVGKKGCCHGGYGVRTNQGTYDFPHTTQFAIPQIQSINRATGPPF